MASIMNQNYKIKETHNVSEASSFEDQKIKSSLKTSPLIRNNKMNNKYRISSINDTPVQNTSKSYGKSPLKIKSSLKTSPLKLWDQHTSIIFNYLYAGVSRV